MQVVLALIILPLVIMERKLNMAVVVGAQVIGVLPQTKMEEIQYMEAVEAAAAVKAILPLDDMVENLEP